MYLLDTNVLSEARKADKADVGVRRFFAAAAQAGFQLDLSAVTIGELRRGVELSHWRGDIDQAHRLETCLEAVITDYRQNILPLDTEAAQVWGTLRVPDPAHSLD
jgi:predicted nucleic acid-binding protein